MEEHIKKFRNLPDIQSISFLEDQIKKLLSLIPLAHSVGINLFISIIGTVAGGMGMNIIPDLIEEINEENINDDRD